MKKLSLSLFCLLMTLPAFAKDISGAWYGALSISGKSLPVIFHLAKAGNAYKATMDSPDQGAMGLPTDTTIFNPPSISITMLKMGIRYTGLYSADSDIITGTFKQGGAQLPLVLKRDNSAAPPVAKKLPKRPQDPVDFPYRREEVSFQNKKAGCTLAGTLTMPASGKASKIVILITGSGPQNRDEEVRAFNHRPFLVWADWLTRQGIGVLRYDDRGVGKSTGSFTAATSADFAGDAEAALKYLQSRKDLAGAGIGLMGHSEGGMIAPMVAARNKSVAFVVLLAGPGIPAARLLLRQTDDQARLAHTPADVAALNHDANAAAFQYVNDHPEAGTDSLRAGLSRVLAAHLAHYPASALEGTSVDDIVQQQVGTFIVPWFRYFITFDPAVYLKKTACPVLAINGTLDMQVNAEENLAGIRKALADGGNTRAKIVPLEGLNHLLQQATTGAVEEYGSLEETVNPAALKTVSAWISHL